MSAVRRRAIQTAAWLAVSVLGAAAQAQDSPAPVGSARELLGLYGFDDSYFAKLPDATPLDGDQTEPLLRGLFAFRKFTREEVARWRQPGRDLPQWLADAPKHAGEIIAVRGRLKRVTRVRPDPEIARRFDLTQYFRCDVELTAPRADTTIFALAIPRAWLGDDENERASDVRCGASALFLKRQSSDASQPAPVFLAQRMAWYPDDGNFATLGNLGFDAGLIDGVRDKSSLANSTDLEREAFYQLLDAVNRTGPGELQAVAATELRAARQRWEIDLRGRAPDDPSTAALRAELARQIERADDDHADDITPLFNAPEAARGRLVTLVGTARRAMEIRVDDPDIRARFGIERYFEVEFVTPDSRGNPLAICVRELPPGMPLGEEIYEPIRATGFFLKTWGFRTAQSGEAAPGEIRRQLAPLLIGRDIAWLRPAAEPETPRGWIIGGVAAVTALAIGSIWWIHRDSRRRLLALPERIETPDRSAGE